MKHFIYLILFIFISSISTFAQKENEPVYDEFIKNFKKEYFTLEMLFQAVADFQPERTMTGNNGFSISNMRLKMFGTLDNNFGYFFQASFIASPSLLDAVVKYKFKDYLSIDAGQFKAPFSKEFLTYAGNIDFVNRSQAATFLSPKRQIGLQLRGNIANKIFEYRAGIFNGNGQNKLSNDNNTFMYVGRLTAKLKTTNSLYEFGLNAAYANNNTQGIFEKDFIGKKTMLGGDLRIEINQFLIASEYTINTLDGTLDSILTNRKPYGYHITAGYKFGSNHQVLVRYDNLSPDGVTDNSEFYIFGYNFWPTSATEIQFNYIIDSKQSEFNSHWFLFNFQLSL